jgi:hypothetical protein
MIYAEYESFAYNQLMQVDFIRFKPFNLAQRLKSKLKK